MREAWLHFGQVRRGAGIAPRLEVRQVEKLRSLDYSLHCVAEILGRDRHDWLSHNLLFHAVIRGFTGDDYVVNVTFAEPGGSDAHEFTARGQFLQVFCADITHSAAQPSD